MADKKKLTLREEFITSESDRRQHQAMEKKESAMWTVFWAKLMQSKGYSNVAIAKRLGLAESTIRYHLKKEA